MKLTHFALAGLFLLIAAGIYLTLQNDMEGQVAHLKADFDRENQRREREHKEALAKATAEAKAAADNTRELAAGPGAVEKPSATPDLDAALEDPETKQALSRVKSLVTPGPPPLELEPGPPVPPDPANPGVADTALLEREEAVIDTAREEAERIARETAELNNAPVEVPPEKLSNLQSLIVSQPRIARVSDARPADNTDFIVLDEGSNKGLKAGDRFALRRGTAIIARIVIGDTVRESQCVANVVPRSLVTGIIIRPGDEVIQFDR